MLRIRLLRTGRKNVPQFRLVVTPRRTAPKTGKFLEVLGFYNAIKHERNIKKERVEYWLSQGAQPSDTVRNMLISAGILAGKKVPVHKKPRPSIASGEGGANEKKEKVPDQNLPQANKQAEGLTKE